MPNLFALIDPNWGNPRVVTHTVAETEEEAAKLAIQPTDKSSVGMYSGASMYPLPLGTEGSIDRLNEKGFHVRPISVNIIEPAAEEPEGYRIDLEEDSSVYIDMEKLFIELGADQYTFVSLDHDGVLIVKADEGPVTEEVHERYVYRSEGEGTSNEKWGDCEWEFCGSDRVIPDPD